MNLMDFLHRIGNPKAKPANFALAFVFLAAVLFILAGSIAAHFARGVRESEASVCAQENVVCAGSGQKTVK